MQKNDSSKTAGSTHDRAQSVVVVNRKYLKHPSVEARANLVDSSQSGHSAMKIEVKQHVDLEQLEKKIHQIQEKVEEIKNDPVKSKEFSEQVKKAAAPRTKKSFNAAKVIKRAKTSSKTAVKMSSKRDFDMEEFNNRMRARSKRATRPAPKKLTAKELKEQAIKKALSSTSHHTPAKPEHIPLHFGAARILLALSCAAVVVFAIVYFVNLNMPDMSLKVAAMQTGIDATYPSYVPRGFNINDIASENGKISLNFRNAETGDSFIIEEEKTSWDSNALLTNYVKQNFKDSFSTIREQGLTIYIDDNNAAWVNGGIAYKLKITSGEITKKQIRSIAVSL